MTTIKRSDLNRVKMSVNPPKEIVDAGFKVIWRDNVHEYVGLGWINLGAASDEQYNQLPIIED